jgi:hypothetical protein
MFRDRRQSELNIVRYTIPNPSALEEALEGPLLILSSDWTRPTLLGTNCIPRLHVLPNPRISSFNFLVQVLELLNVLDKLWCLHSLHSRFELCDIRK